MNFIDPGVLYTVDALVGAMIRCAILDALGEDHEEALNGHWWLDVSGLAHVLQHPGAAQFHPDARRGTPRKATVALAAIGA